MQIGTFTYTRTNTLYFCILLLFLFAIVNFNNQFQIYMRHYSDRHNIISHLGFLQQTSLTIINLIDVARSGMLQKKEFILPCIPWKNRTSVSKSPLQRHHFFKPIISILEQSKLLEIFQVFKTVCDWSNLTYVLYGGSLLGSYRHHGLVPWDDDIDVLMNESERFRIYQHFKNIPGYTLCTPQNRQWKLYQRSDKSHKSCSENVWPYVDIFFFSENATSIWDNNEMYKHVYNFAKEDIFPLKITIFEGQFASVPRNTYSVLQRSYDVDLCVTALYSHKNESVRDGKVVSVPCKRILPYFPFVFRSCEKGVISEYLVHNSIVSYKILTDQSCNANIP